MSDNSSIPVDHEAEWLNKCLDLSTEKLWSQLNHSIAVGAVAVTDIHVVGDDGGGKLGVGEVGVLGWTVEH